MVTLLMKPRNTGMHVRFLLNAKVEILFGNSVFVRNVCFFILSQRRLTGSQRQAVHEKNIEWVDCHVFHNSSSIIIIIIIIIIINIIMATITITHHKHDTTNSI